MLIPNFVNEILFNKKTCKKINNKNKPAFFNKIFGVKTIIFKIVRQRYRIFEFKY